ncbi:MAG: NEAT domain-containing protein, partial [Peptostreptococcaceae bacterium]
MILKNKIYKTTAIALAVISVFGANLQYVNAYEQINVAQVLSQYVDGNYELNTKLLNASDTGKDSMANTYLKSSSIEIKNGKMEMKMIFTSGNLIKEVTPTVNGSSVEATVTLDEATSERTVIFEIPSIDADIRLGVKINPFGDMVVNATCIVEASFKTEPDKVEDNDSSTDEGSTEDNSPGEENPEGDTGDSNIGDNNQGEESTGGNTGNNDSNGS